MASFKFSALLALQGLPLIPGEPFAEEDIAYHMQGWRDKLPPPISPLGGERKEMNIKAHRAKT